MRTPWTGARGSALAPARRQERPVRSLPSGSTRACRGKPGTACPGVLASSLGHCGVRTGYASDDGPAHARIPARVAWLGSVSCGEAGVRVCAGLGVLITRDRAARKRTRWPINDIAWMVFPEVRARNGARHATSMPLKRIAPTAGAAAAERCKTGYCDRRVLFLPRPISSARMDPRRWYLRHKRREAAEALG